MRIRTGFCLLICCCAGLTACTAATPKGPDVTVSTPSVGRPQPPSSVQAALSREAFTPYAALGQSNNDGLAPNESSNALSNACMTAAGYPNSGNAPFAISLGPANLAFSQPWGEWGYLGVAEAEQYGFRVPPGSALSALGIDVPPPDTNPASLPEAEQTAIGKCATIEQDFTNATDNGALAGIQTLSNDIYNDVLKDAAVKDATQAWTACMAKNGYSFHQPQTVFFQERQTMYGNSHADKPERPGKRRRQPGADRGGRHGCQLHPVRGPGRDLLRRPGQLRAAARQRQRPGAHRRGPAVPHRLRQGAEQAPGAAATTPSDT